MALATPVPAEGTATGEERPRRVHAARRPRRRCWSRSSRRSSAATPATTPPSSSGPPRRPRWPTPASSGGPGEPYITHPIAVAGIVADLGLDAQTVAAALLHDAVEDTGVTTEVIDRDFGPAVALIVDGVTKLDRLQFDSKEAQQAATVRKMLVAMANDWRVLIIKLADRLHNMRTLAVMPEWKQRRTAQETLDIYAPLAHRLGIQEVQAGSWRTWPSPPSTPSATPRSSRWWPAGPPCATSSWPGCWSRCGSGWPPRGSAPR